MEQAESTIAAGSVSGKGETERVELDRAGQNLARRVAESKATVPHLYLRATVDMGAALEMLSGLTELARTDGSPASGDAASGGATPSTAASGDATPTTEDLVIRAAALALREHPRANGSWRDGGLELYSRVNVGFTVADGDSQVVPTIADADGLDVLAIAARRSELAARVAAGSLTAAALAGGTFTVTDLGAFGVRTFDPVVGGGQAAALGTGEVVERPVARSGHVKTAPVMEISLASDHRILFGAAAAAFLLTIRTNLEEPERLT
jgi:pyruvate dehydrogenase E2 component (dihydrolipoamide acetyltransferase)